MEQFVDFLVLGAGPEWRRLGEGERRRGREEFAAELGSRKVRAFSYSVTGLREGADLMLWLRADSPDSLQRRVSSLLLTGLGRHLEVTQVLFGMVRESVYVRRQDAQEQAMGSEDRRKYLIVYPFTKTTEWYLLPKEERQRMMNDHISVGKRFDTVRQLLAYSYGLGDQEFIVSYETDSLEDFQDLVKALRETEVRKYTLRDTPLIVGVHRPIGEALKLLG